jgi:hypothetical protein
LVSQATNLLLADALVVGVTRKGSGGVLIEHVALHAELDPLGSVPADTEEVGNLLYRVS